MGTSGSEKRNFGGLTMTYRIVARINMHNPPFTLLHISPDSILGGLIIIITIIIIIIIIIRVFKLNFSGPCDFYVTRRRWVKLILIQIKLTASVWNARGE